MAGGAVCVDDNRRSVDLHTRNVYRTGYAELTDATIERVYVPAWPS